VNRPSLLKDQSTRLFDARRLIVGICITAAAYAILEISRADGSEVNRAAAATCVCDESTGCLQHVCLFRN